MNGWKLIDRATHLDAVQGAGEERTEVYLIYSEGVPQLATLQRAESNGYSRLLPAGRATVRRAI